MNNDKFRVYLRALELNDYKTTVKWRTDDDISYGYGNIKHFVSSENEKKWVEERILSKKDVTAGICIKETDELIGLVFLTDIDVHNKTGHCPSFIGAKEHWRKGYATEARMLILRYAFYERGLQRIWAEIIEDNIASIRMCEKCGFVKEGLMRKTRLRGSEFKNEYILGVLKEDFDKIWNEKYGK